MHITTYHRRLNWMQTDTRRTYSTSIFLYKILNFYAPTYQLELYKKRQSSRLVRKGTGDLNTGLY